MLLAALERAKERDLLRRPFPALEVPVEYDEREGGGRLVGEEKKNKGED